MSMHSNEPWLIEHFIFKDRESGYYERFSEVWCFVFVTNASVAADLNRNSLFEDRGESVAIRRSADFRFEEETVQ